MLINNLLFGRMLFFGSVFLFSCINSPQESMTPFQVNEYYTNIFDSLHIKGKEWGGTFTKVHITKRYSLLHSHTKDMLRFVNSKMNEINKFQDLNDSKEYRLTMLRFLESERNAIISVFMPLEKLDSTSSPTQEEDAFNAIRNCSDRENSVQDEVIKVQNEFATRYNCEKWER